MSDVIAEADALADGTTATTSAMTLSLRQGRKRDWMEGYMLTVKGTFQNGSAQPLEPIEGRDGQSVIIVFVDEVQRRDDSLDDDWDKLMQLIADNVVDTGIEDLAHQHDHYLRGTPKKSL
jgi:hypothetical protein